MGKFEKLLDRWSIKHPASAPSNDIIHLAEHYGLRIRSGKGSHFVINDPRLNQFSKKHPNLGIIGNIMSIPLTGGSRVKGIYIKRLVLFIRYIQEANHESN